jgi:hypothetical protein
MQILNLGIWEIFFVLLIMLIVLGPDNMMKTARDLGRFVSRATKSPMWATLLSTSREIRELPTRIVREAGMEETIKEIQQETGRLSTEVEGELALATEQVDLADQEIQATNKDIARQSVPVAFSMRSEPGDSEPKEAEDVSAPLETDPAEEIEEMVEDAVEDAVPDPEKRSIAPPAIIESGEEISITEDFVEPAIEDTEEEPAAKAESTADVDDDGRDFGIPPAVIDSDAESFEEAIIEPLVEISKPEPLLDNLIKNRPMTRIPKRKPGAKLPKDVPPPPVEIPDEKTEHDSEDEETDTAVE